jgi:hypothetical protein
LLCSDEAYLIDFALKHEFTCRPASRDKRKYVPETGRC